MSQWGPRPYQGPPGWRPPKVTRAPGQPRPPLQPVGAYPYPYAAQAHPPQQRPAVDPRYRGPQWAAPLPQRPPRAERAQRPVAAAVPQQARPQKKVKKGSGCVTALVTVVFVALIGVGAIAVLAAFVPGIAQLVAEGDEEITLPDNHAVLPASTPLGGKPDAVAQSTWTSGTCGDFSKERDRDTYFATRNHGSAAVLRGKVAILHILVGSPTLRWTKAGQTNVNRAALMSQEYVLTQAAKYKVPVHYDVIPWALNTTLELPSLSANTNNLLSDDTMRAVRDTSKAAVEQALGTRLERVVDDFKKNGYDEVGFVIHFPTTTTARDFAFAAYRTDPNDHAEAAFIFSPTSDFGHFAVTVTHEQFHLFGADDLYRVENVDKRDQHDIMGEYCTGFRQAALNDATAYAIGWLPTAPPRPYKFEDK